MLKKLSRRKQFISKYLRWLPKKNLFLSLISGGLFTLTAPPFNMWFLGFFAFIPLFIIQEEVQNSKKIFIYGWISGFTSFALSFAWLIDTIEIFGQLPFFISLLIFLVFCLVFSLKMGLFFWLADIFEYYSLPPLLCYGSAILIVELFFPELFPYYAGNSQVSNPYFMQIIDIIGIKGMSFIVMSINFLLYELLMHRQKRMLLVLVSIIFIIYSYGIIRIIQINELKKITPGLNIGAIQPDTPFLPSITQTDLVNIRKNVLSLTDELKKKSKTPLDIIVWPESATPFQISGSSPLSADIRNYIAADNSYYVFNEVDYDAYKSGREVYSVATLMSPGGQVAGKYRKIYLLPFGEYLPLSEYFPALNKFFPQVGDFKPGNEIKNFQVKGQFYFSSLICYEIIHPNFVRQFIRKGSDLILNLTNDKWFGKTNATYRHLWLLIPRAIENRVPIVRATNSGTSVFVDQTGEITSGPTDIYVTATLHQQVPIIKGIYGLYTYLGDAINLLIIVYSVYLMVKYLILRKRKPLPVKVN